MQRIKKTFKPDKKIWSGRPHSNWTCLWNYAHISRHWIVLWTVCVYSHVTRRLRDCYGTFCSLDSVNQTITQRSYRQIQDFRVLDTTEGPFWKLLVFTRSKSDCSEEADTKRPIENQYCVLEGKALALRRLKDTALWLWPWFRQWKSHDPVFIDIASIPACDGQTDGHDALCAAMPSWA